MNKRTKLILKATSMLIVTIFAVLAFLLVGIKLFKFQIYTVLSGSMEPNYHVGSVIYVKTINHKELKKGDVITFKLEGDTNATHRIIEIVKENDNSIKFRTKGDANESADSKLVEPQDIRGKVIFTIPILGYITANISRPPGNIVMIAIGLMSLAIVFVIDSMLNEEKQPQKINGGKYEKKGVIDS